MAPTATASISAGDALGITLWAEGGGGALAASGLPGFASADLAIGGPAGPGDARLDLLPLVESPLLHAGPIAVPADIRAFGDECSTYKTDPGTWLWLGPGPAA